MIIFIFWIIFRLFRKQTVVFWANTYMQVFPIVSKMQMGAALGSGLGPEYIYISTTVNSFR